MQVPFPALTDMLFQCEDETALVFPASFTGGSTPYLLGLNLERIPFPGLLNCFCHSPR